MSSPPRRFELIRKDGHKFLFDRTDINLMDLAGLLAGIKPVVYSNCEKESVPHVQRLADFFSLKIDVLEPWNSIKAYIPGQKVILLAQDKKDLLKAAALGRRDRATVDSLEWGSLLGYPPCCVKFFQAWRKSNPGLKGGDLIPRILRNTKKKGPYPFYFNNIFNLSSRLAPGMGESRNLAKLDGINKPLALHTSFVIPWHPCSYDCPESAAAGLKSWGFIEKLVPEFARELRSCLSRPILYLNRWEFAVLEGEVVSPLSCRYSGVMAPKSLLAGEAAKVLGAGESLILKADRVVIYKGKRRIAEIPGHEPVLLSFV